MQRVIAMQVKPEEVELIRRDYTANGGWETFLSYEDPRQDILVGLLRLRRVSGSLSQPRRGAAVAAADACCGGTHCTAGEHASTQPAVGGGTSRAGSSSGAVGARTQPEAAGQQHSDSPAVCASDAQPPVPSASSSTAATGAEQSRRPVAAHGGRGVGSGAETQPELRGRCSIVRELHVYGTAVAVHARDSQHQQHQA